MQWCTRPFFNPTSNSPLPWTLISAVWGSGGLGRERGLVRIPCGVGFGAETQPSVAKRNVFETFWAVVGIKEIRRAKI